MHTCPNHVKAVGWRQGERHGASETAATAHAASCVVPAAGVNERKEYRVAGLAEPISHYTDAVAANGLLFVSGCVAVDVDGRVVGDDIVAQTRQVFANIGAILRAAGAGFEDVVKVTVYLLDIDDRPRINAVRQEVFGDARPASTLVEVSRLAVPGARVEIDAIARVNEG
jgi:2-iminobutanoate/2-iminopropanoate deaminase